MQVDEQVFLDLAEDAAKIVFLDLEATGLKGDYNSILVFSLKPYGKKSYSFTVGQPGNDLRVCREAKEALESYNCWVGYYSKGYDIPMLNTRLLKWGMRPVEKQPHLDMYFTLKANLLTARRSQAHLLEWLETPQQKMTISAETWNRVLSDFGPTINTLRKRCESDVAGLESLYKKTRHVIREIKK